jgi:glycine cleavage system aminomethyltransferase T
VVAVVTDPPASADPAERLPPLAEWLRHAGAVIVARDGRPVPAHYGSAATELAVCVKGVGLALRSDLDTLGLSGHHAWLDHALGKTLGGRVPEAGTATAIAGALCCRIDAQHAVVAAPPGAAARWRRIAREAIVAGSPIALADRSTALAALSLVGPRGARVLERAGLACELELLQVHAGSLGGVSAVVAREAVERYLILVPEQLAAQAWRELVEAGREFGLSLVGSDALARLAAATRALASLP